MPPGNGPFPAVFVPFYEPETSVGLNKDPKAKLRDFALQRLAEEDPRVPQRDLSAPERGGEEVLEREDEDQEIAVNRNTIGAEEASECSQWGQGQRKAFRLSTRE